MGIQRYTLLSCLAFALLSWPASVAAQTEIPGAPSLFRSPSIGANHSVTGIFDPGPRPPGSSPAFELDERYPLSTPASKIAAGDLDQDGDVDLIVSMGGSVAVLLREAHGFAPPIEMPLSVNPNTLAVADVDGDGQPEVLAAAGQAGTLSQFDWTGGTLALKRSQQLGAEVSAGIFDVTVFDADRDGDPDLALANTDSNTVVVLLNNGAGSFDAAQILHRGPADGPPHLTAHVDAGDMNGDGIPDLVAVSSREIEIAVFPGLGNGAFSNTPLTVIPTIFPADLALGDVDGDGDLDVAITAERLIGIEINDGTGHLAWFKSFDARYTYVYCVAFADLDGDGRQELLATNFAERSYEGNRVSVYRDGLTGEVPPSRDYMTDLGPRALVAADLNGDGLEDVATINAGTYMGPGAPTTGSISVLYNRGGGVLRSGTDILIPGTGQYSDTRDRWLLDIHALDVGGQPGLLVAEGRNTYLMRKQGDTFAQPEFVAEGLMTAVRDFDDDGHEDIFALVGIGTYEIQLGDGQGGFHPASRFTLIPAPSFADIDGDGLPDMLLSTPEGRAIRWNLGGGQFAAAEPFVGLPYGVGEDLDGERGAEMIDFRNGPGRADTVEIWRNEKGRRFADPVRIGLLSDGSNEGLDEIPMSLKVADCNGDGKMDIIVMGAALFGPGYVAAVIQGEGFTWTAMPSVYGGQEPTGWVVEDFDLEGFPDVAIAEANTEDPGRTRILRGVGDGTFEDAGIYYPGDYPIGITTGDFNGDGRPDLAVACLRHGAVALHMNVSRTPEPRHVVAIVERAEVEDGRRAYRVVGAERSRCAGREGGAGAPLGGGWAPRRCCLRDGWRWMTRTSRPGGGTDIGWWRRSRGL